MVVLSQSLACLTNTEFIRVLSWQSNEVEHQIDNFSRLQNAQMYQEHQVVMHPKASFIHGAIVFDFTSKMVITNDVPF